MSDEKLAHETTEPPVQKLLVKMPEAAAMIGESERTVRRLMDQGEFRSVKRGRSRLLLVSDLQDFVHRLVQQSNRAT